ncbi:hypothetical protein DSM106972_049660 [Dulcicalothrix desertica PCC 7102]|uniref:MobA/VirD2-like nuclease domain-containing protein n=1 Tax=Dulcicalothrix desertica PCC 7102 TaxID=232991 RepID=A0A3S1CJR4_9CYAN|nr:relaxase/mobilization nuclease domain-containing protein [Dulcicalothrix desertica]RUT04052.1 hypothetical protein DSM106972_049660 [Dulcicalothrix desertica PCC 7102]TWH43546.1 relaxase/mobilization nuclease-like protein [Dulcicalothrix desertica PCC 7102]
MIGKVKKGKHFVGLTRYILEKEEAQLLCTNLAGETPIDFYRQLAATQQLNPRVKSPVSHISISFAQGEKPPTQQLQEIVKGAMKGMGFDKNLYFAATHDDCDHFHIHIGASRINIDGGCVSDWYDKRRLEKVLRNLESQFNLTPVPCSWEVEHAAPNCGQKRRMRREQEEFDSCLRRQQANCSALEKIQNTVEVVIKPEMTITQFVNQLELEGVETQFKVDNDGAIQGISYSVDSVAFQGSKLGRNTKACTIKGLLSRGIKIDLEQDLDAIVLCTNHKDLSDELIDKIKHHPNNLDLNTSGANNPTQTALTLESNSRRRQLELELN